MPFFFQPRRQNTRIVRISQREDQRVDPNSPAAKLQERYDSLFSQKKVYLLFHLMILVYLGMFIKPKVFPDFSDQQENGPSEKDKIDSPADYKAHIREYTTKCTANQQMCYTVYIVVLSMDFVNSSFSMCCFYLKSVQTRSGHHLMRQLEVSHYINLCIFNVPYIMILIPQSVFYFSLDDQTISECKEMSGGYKGFYESFQIVIFFSYLQMPYFVIASLIMAFFPPQDPQPPENEAENLERELQEDRRRNYELQPPVVRINQIRDSRVITQQLINKYVNDYLPSIQLSKDPNDESQSQCGICLGEFDETQPIKLLNCDETDKDDCLQHIFHQECISQWFYKKVECPLCRKNFEDEVLRTQPQHRAETRFSIVQLNQENSESNNQSEVASAYEQALREAIQEVRER